MGLTCQCWFLDELWELRVTDGAHWALGWMITDAALGVSGLWYPGEEPGSFADDSSVEGRLLEGSCALDSLLGALLGSTSHSALPLVLVLTLPLRVVMLLAPWQALSTASPFSLTHLQ